MNLSSLLKTARAWGYACGNFRFADLTLPREGVKKEPRCFTDEEVRNIIAHAPEPLGTIVAVTAVLGLRIGETLAATPIRCGLRKARDVEGAGDADAPSPPEA